MLKQFYVNSAKKLYTCLLDWCLQTAVANPGEVKVKKEVFKHITEQTDQNVYSCLLLQALIITQVINSLSDMENLIKDTVAEHQAKEIEDKVAQEGAAWSQKERKLMERR